MKQNNISAVLILVVGLILILYCGSSRDKKSTDDSAKWNSSFIGRRSDTIKVFAQEPGGLKITELVKINNRWCLRGDTSSVVDNVEIIQESKVSVISLTYTYEDRTFVYRTDRYDK